MISKDVSSQKSPVATNKFLDSDSAMSCSASASYALVSFRYLRIRKD